MVWYGMVEVCEGAPVAVSGWVLTDRHDVRPCAASSLLRETISVSNIIGGTVLARVFSGPTRVDLRKWAKMACSRTFNLESERY